ncbi:hypothetical protein B0H17DRAFT_1150203 [Mycena rosella]|uniref:Uncharacterized protein n=1 Tax=Mycena rosella TaxID=1033263 RepID=A0AAD7BV57_MYCRO|nr:hypothetical protein B0H17DRAFT_1150203 [Mycena rosella]
MYTGGIPGTGVHELDLVRKRRRSASLGFSNSEGRAKRARSGSHGSNQSWEADWQDDDDDDLPSFLKPATLPFVFDPASTGLTSSSTSASLAQSSANGPSRIIRKANPAPRKGLHIPKSSSNIWRRY